MHILPSQSSSRMPVINLASTVSKTEAILYPLQDLCRQYPKEVQKASKQAGYTVRKQLVPEEWVSHSLSNSFLANHLSPPSQWEELLARAHSERIGGELCAWFGTCDCSSVAPSHHGNPSLTSFKLPTTVQDDDLALNLYQTLESGEGTWKDLHAVMRSLWSAPDPVLGEGAKSTYLLSFLAAAALKTDGMLINMKQLVTTVSHLKYGARAFCMVDEPAECTLQLPCKYRFVKVARMAVRRPHTQGGVLERAWGLSCCNGDGWIRITHIELSIICWQHGWKRMRQRGSTGRGWRYSCIDYRLQIVNPNKWWLLYHIPERRDYWVDALPKIRTVAEKQPVGTITLLSCNSGSWSSWLRRHEISPDPIRFVQPVIDASLYLETHFRQDICCRWTHTIHALRTEGLWLARLSKHTFRNQKVQISKLLFDISMRVRIDLQITKLISMWIESIQRFKYAYLLL